MAQHFLLSAAARTLSLRQIYKAGEDAAYATFCTLRWPETDGEAVCPDCGCFEVYKITTRRTFKCKACYRQLSVTSGTIFASRKLSFADILAAICLFVNGSKGRSAVQLSRELGVQYKTAWVMAHKLRESMQDEYKARRSRAKLRLMALTSVATSAPPITARIALTVAASATRLAPAALLSSPALARAGP